MAKKILALQELPGVVIDPGEGQSTSSIFCGSSREADYSTCSISCGDTK